MKKRRTILIMLSFGMLVATGAITLSHEPETTPEARTVGRVETNGLTTRTFKVDPDIVNGVLTGRHPTSTGVSPISWDAPDSSSRDLLAPRPGFLGGIPSAQGGTPREILSQFLAAAGVELSPPKSISYDPTRGVLMVRATDSDLESIERAIQLMITLRPQVCIEARYIELEESGSDEDLFLGIVGPDAGVRRPTPVTNHTPAGVRDQPTNAQARRGLQGPPTVANAGRTEAELKRILTPSQLRVVIQRLEHRKGATLVWAPSVITLSGRQVRIRIGEARSNTTGWQTVRAQGLSGFDAEPFEIGPALDVVPYVRSDGYTINMAVVPTMKGFVDYDDPGSVILQEFHPANRLDALQPMGRNDPAGPPSRYVPSIQPAGLSKSRLRDVASSGTLWDGQTMVLCAVGDMPKTKDKTRSLSDPPLTGKPFRPESNMGRRTRIIVFVTPVIVDPTGKPVHTRGQMPFRDRRVPQPQPTDNSEDRGR